MMSGNSLARLGLVLGVLAALALPGCGGGGTGGAGPDGAGQGLELMNFLQAGQDNVPINRILEFRFSEPVNPATITSGSIQLREGPSYGLSVKGSFVVEGAVVYFEPVLPSLCDKSDAGFKPGTTYRVTLMGFPEEYAIRNTQGQPLTATETFEFATTPESDPDYLEDQVPGQPPLVTFATPGDGEAAVPVMAGNEVLIGFSENVSPCSINDTSVSMWVYETGDPGVTNVVPDGETNAGHETGFDPWYDSLPDNKLSWGGNATSVSPPQRVPATLVLSQDFTTTQLSVKPNFGRFPENALVVVRLTFDIVDFGGTPLSPLTLSFTTENLPQQSGSMTVNFDTATESWPAARRTADVDTARSPGKAQGWMLFAGDGDNGPDMNAPSFPQLSPFACASRLNDGIPDHFQPTENVTINTGASRIPESCANKTDGSNAVVYEFSTFRIKNGVTVTVTGVNPLILLVQGEMLIESGGILAAKGGDGKPGTQGTSASSAQGGAGGIGVAGGGKGGKGWARMESGSQYYGDDGNVGYGSEDYNTVDEQGGLGAGHGNVAAGSSAYSSPTNASSPSGGGGGHATPGVAGTANFGSSSVTAIDVVDGAGGEIYPTSGSPEKLYSPSAGSGGGASGYSGNSTYWDQYAYGYYHAAGSGGGAGGGFVDITCQGDIRIYGTIDVGGGRGANGGYGGYWGAGGAGGGAGGACRLLTPANIDVTNGTISTAGGPGGNGSSAQYMTLTPLNNGGSGGSGYIALEDGDAVVTGVVSANLTPAFGGEGFYVGKFQATRFKGGGLQSEAVSDPLLVGPLTPPSFVTPKASDFVCAIPSNAALPPDGTGIIVEGRGLGMLPDGTPDPSAPNAWYTICYFQYSGSPNNPTIRTASNPPDADPGENNLGAGIANLDGSLYLEIRVRFFLPATIGAVDPGPYLDKMTLNFTYDQ